MSNDGGMTANWVAISAAVIGAIATIVSSLITYKAGIKAGQSVTGGTNDSSHSSTYENIYRKGGLVVFGSYVWRVLDVQKDRALIITADIIDQRPYNATFSSVTWKTCSLRTYLNGTFYNSFPPAERKKIMLTLNTNNDTSYVSASGKKVFTKGGEKTSDYVFLLSAAEAAEHFRMQNKPTEDLKDWSDKPEWKNYWPEKSPQSYRAIAWYDDRVFWWWLRSPGGRSPSQAMAVYFNGYTFLDGYNIKQTTLEGVDGGVRPAMWVSLEA